MKSIHKYMINLLTEKGIIESHDDDLGKEFEAEGFIGFTYECLFIFISMLNKQEIERIRKRFVMIDFRNGDVSHFLDYLKKAYLEHLIKYKSL